MVAEIGPNPIYFVSIPLYYLHVPVTGRGLVLSSLATVADPQEPGARSSLTAELHHGTDTPSDTLLPDQLSALTPCSTCRSVAPSCPCCWLPPGPATPATGRQQQPLLLPPWPRWPAVSSLDWMYNSLGSTFLGHSRHHHTVELDKQLTSGRCEAHQRYR